MSTDLDERAIVERQARPSADFDAKYRRCHEHNRARYWCGCYYTDAMRSAR